VAGVALGELAKLGRDKLTLVIDAPIEAFGLWAEQLVAESTGKQGRGILPIADEPLAAADAYGPDRVFVHVRNADAPDAGHEAAIEALAGAGHPTVTVNAHGAGDLGRLFFYSEFATAVVGWVLQINRSTSPTSRRPRTHRARAHRRRTCRRRWSARRAARRPGAAALRRDHGYLPYDAATEQAVHDLRAALIERYGVATTWG